MDLIQHMEDNLNQNFTDSQHVANFIQIGKAAEAEFNAKYHNGEFSDPALFDPEADHPVTWANVKLWETKLSVKPPNLYSIWFSVIWYLYLDHFWLKSASVYQE